MQRILCYGIVPPETIRQLLANRGIDYDSFEYASEAELPRLNRQVLARTLERWESEMPAVVITAQSFQAAILRKECARKSFLFTPIIIAPR